MTDRPDTLLNIQVLRAVAAMLVVCAHTGTIWQSYDIEPAWLLFGFSGVDLFFVISGFIMVYTTKDTTTPAQFARNRIIRIVPLYYVMTFFVFALVLVAPSLFKATLADPAALAKSLLFIPFEKSNGNVQPIVFVGWTLNYEMAFYALFAVAIWFGRFRNMAVIGVIAVAACGHLFATGLFAVFYTDPIILEFAAGMLIAIAFRSQVSGLRFGLVAGGCLVAAGFTALVVLQGETDVHRVVRYGIPAIAIVVGALALEQGNLRLNRFQLLGDASYSVYLTHFFVTLGVAKIAAKVGGPVWMAVVFFLVALIMSAVVGIVVHKIVEKPAVSWIKSRART